MTTGANTDISANQRLVNLEAAVFGGPNPAGTAGSAEQTNTFHLTGSADALPNAGPSLQTTIYSIDTAGVDAITLTTPVAGGPGTGDDGKTLTFIDTGGHAHTITCAASTIVPSHHLVTFGGTAGAVVTLRALGGLWYPSFSTGVTVS